jgi:hypothetical protein
MGLVKVGKPGCGSFYAVRVGTCGSAVTALEQLRKCHTLQCSKNHKTINAKGAWHFRRHVCIGARRQWFGAAAKRARLKKRAEETCVN